MCNHSPNRILKLLYLVDVNTIMLPLVILQKIVATLKTVLVWDLHAIDWNGNPGALVTPVKPRSGSRGLKKLQTNSRTEKAADDM